MDELKQLRKDLNHDLGLLYKRQEYLKKSHERFKRELVDLKVVLESIASVSKEDVVVEVDDKEDMGYA